MVIGNPKVLTSLGQQAKNLYNVKQEQSGNIAEEEVALTIEEPNEPDLLVNALDNFWIREKPESLTLSDIKLIDRYLPENFCFCGGIDLDDSFITSKKQNLKSRVPPFDAPEPLENLDDLQEILTALGAISQSDASAQFALTFLVPALLNTVELIPSHQKTCSDRFYDVWQRYFLPIAVALQGKHLCIYRLINLVISRYDYVAGTINEVEQERVRKTEQERIESIEKKRVKSIAENNAELQDSLQLKSFYFKLHSTLETEFQEVISCEGKRPCGARTQWTDLLKDLCENSFYNSTFYDWLGNNTSCDYDGITWVTNQTANSGVTYFDAYVNHLRIEKIYPHCEKPLQSKYDSVKDYLQTIKDRYKVHGTELGECQGNKKYRYIPTSMIEICRSTQITSRNFCANIKLRRHNGGIRNAKFFSIEKSILKSDFKNATKNFYCLFRYEDKEEKDLGMRRRLQNYVDKTKRTLNRLDSDIARINSEISELENRKPTTPTPVTNATTPIKSLYPPIPQLKALVSQRLNIIHTSLYITMMLAPSVFVDIPMLMSKQLNFVLRCRAMIRTFASALMGISTGLKLYGSLTFTDYFSEITNGKLKENKYLEAIDSDIQRVIDYSYLGGCALLFLDGAIDLTQSSVAMVKQYLSFKKHDISSTTTPALYNIKENGRMDASTRVAHILTSGFALPLSATLSALYDARVTVNIPGMKWLKTIPPQVLMLFGLMRNGTGIHEEQCADDTLTQKSACDQGAMLLLEALAIRAFVGMEHAIKRLNQVESRISYQLGLNKLTSHHEIEFLTAFIKCCGYSEEDSKVALVGLEEIYTSGGRNFEKQGNQDTPNEYYVSNQQLRKLLGFIADTRVKDISLLCGNKKGCIGANNIYHEVIVPIINTIAYVEMQSEVYLNATSLDVQPENTLKESESDIIELLEQFNLAQEAFNAENELFFSPEWDGVVSSHFSASAQHSNKERQNNRNDEEELELKPLFTPAEKENTFSSSELTSFQLMSTPGVIMP